MEKQLIIITLLCSVVLTAIPQVHGHGAYNTPNAVRRWYSKVHMMKQKVTELNFYLHDIVSGKNATNIPIVISNSTATSPTLFGLLSAIDDPLTSGPSPSSSIVGRAQGLFASTSLNKVGYHMTFNIVFTAGEYNGSTLSIVGHNPFMDEVRELPVVGGSGVFRLASGTALLNTMKLDNKTGDAVVEYSIMVLHYY